MPYKGTGQAFVDAMSGQIHLLYANGLAAPPNTPEEFRVTFARQVTMREKFIQT